MPEHSTEKRLHITVDVTDTTPVVHCRGRLVAGETDVFYKDLRDLMALYKEIRVNFAEVTHTDSMGLGTLARVYVHAKSVGAVVEFTNVGKPIRQLLGITHMLAVFQTVGENGIRMG